MKTDDEFEGWGQSYGYFLGGDPRNFDPDPEGLMPDELSRWVSDCEAWDAGTPISRDGPHIPFDGGHLPVSNYGMGITHEHAPGRAWRDRLAYLQSELPASTHPSTPTGERER